MKKIKVLHRAATADIGGMEAYVMNYYRHIDRTKFQFDFLTRNERLKEKQQVQELGMQVKTFTATEKNNRDLLIKEINDILDEGYEILHMNTSYWVGFLIEEIAMERHMPKVIVHSHSSGIDQCDSIMRKNAIELHDYYKKRLNRSHATDFFACSKSAADWLFGPQIQRQDICLLRNAIEVEKYVFNPNIRKQMRRQLGVDGKFVIGHVGRFTYQKNHRFLIDAFHELQKTHPESRLLLVGEGRLESEIKAQIKEYNIQNSVQILGWRDDVNHLMQAMDVLVLPSRFEGLPVVLVEAQTAGLHCIVSDLVSEEAAITENLEFCPLDVSRWTERLTLVASGYERKNVEQEITLAGYNIKRAAKELEERYLF